MPARHRSSGASSVMSLPSRLPRPEPGRSIPVMRLNSVDLPAPFGPMKPSASPDASRRSMRSATTMAPNALETALSSSIVALRHSSSNDAEGCEPSPLTQRLHVAAERDLRRLFVFGDDHVVFVTIQAPLAADQRRLGDILR